MKVTFNATPEVDVEVEADVTPDGQVELLAAWTYQGSRHVVDVLSDLGSSVVKALEVEALRAARRSA